AARLEELRRYSLPRSPTANKSEYELARREYETYLRDLLRRSGFSARSVVIESRAPEAPNNPQAAAKKPPYQALTFTVKGNARLPALVKSFDEFYPTPLLHQVKGVETKPPGAGAEPRGDPRGGANPAEPGAAAPGPAAAPVAPAAPGAPGAPRGPGA